MKKIKSLLRTEAFLECVLITFISGLAYLLFVSQFGYFNDDWYLMYAAGAQGPSVFWDIFAIDRPLRALVMIPAYTLFGPNPLYYNLGAFLFRLLSGFAFLWILRMLWPHNRRITLWMTLLFLIYPGFLSQPNAIDYLCHLTGLAAGMFSIGLTIQAIQAHSWTRSILFYGASILLGWFYLGQIEWYIGLEFFRFACILLLVIRQNETLWIKVVRFFQYSLPVLLIPGVFLIWRLFFFESERGATDVDFQLSDLRAEPFTFLFKYLSTLLNDSMDVLINAWWLPLGRLSAGMSMQDWNLGFGVALLVAFSLWIFFRVIQNPEDAESGHRPDWKRDVLWIGLGSIVFGLLPVVLVGRTVDFKNFSRYTLIASIGASLLWPLALSYISNLRVRTILFGILIVSASLTHYANGFTKARETEALRNFWWQVSWRIPQLEPGTTLVTHYSVVAEEDYFTWGPANLIYHPESMQDEYVQPTIYAVLLSEETISKAEALTRQEYSNRRSIVTYPNHRNLLVLTQPKADSCVQVIDHNQVELSDYEDERVVALAPFSEAEQILLSESFHTPPQIPFGDEPFHGWCYYYQRASYARQLEDWAEVVRLGDEANRYVTSNPIEWMPFLEAYAYLDNISRIEEIASLMKMTSDRTAAQQACQILTKMSLTPSTLEVVNKSLCVEK